MSLEKIMNASHKVVGLKQTTKKIKNGEARLVFVAQDAERRVVQPVLDFCREEKIPVIDVPYMDELGKACGIKAGAAVAAILEE